MEDKTIKLSKAEISEIQTLNPSFDKGVMRIAHTGENANNIKISKEAFEKAIPSMFNCPIVAHYIPELEDIGGHDIVVAKKDGKYLIEELTEPVGIVPESAEWHWEKSITSSGEVENLVTDIILWKRQRAYDLIKDNGIVDQSMEIKIRDSEDTTDGLVVKDFYFTAFCLLGTGHNPAYEGASVEVFSEQPYNAQLNEMMTEYRMTFADNTEDTSTEEGDKTNMKLQELLELYQVKEEDLPFDPEGMTDDELEQAFKDAYGEPPAKEEDIEKSEGTVDPAVETEPMVEAADPMADPQPVEPMPEPQAEPKAKVLTSEIIDSLRKQIEALKVIKDDDWGWEYPVCSYCDCFVDTNEVVYYDEEKEQFLKVPFTVDGDDIFIDFSKPVKQVPTFRDYVSTEAEPPAIRIMFSEQVDAIKKGMTDKYSALDAKFSEATETINSYRLCDVRDLFAKFEKELSDTAEFSSLKDKFSAPESMADLSMKDLEDKLYSLVGRKNIRFSSNKPLTSVGVASKNEEEPKKHSSRYGNLL